MSQGMTTLDAARILGVTRIRVCQLVFQRKIIGEKFGMMWVLQPSSVRSYWERQIARASR